MSERKARDSFILHIDDFEDIDKLKNPEVGKLLRAIIAYATGQDIPAMGVQASTMFGYIRRHMERDMLKYEETCAKRAAAGKRGGRPRKQETENQEEAKKANGFFVKQNNPDTEPDPDIDIDSDIDPDTEPDSDAVAPPDGGPGYESGLQAQERENRIRTLETFIRLYKQGAMGDKEDYAHWSGELEKLKGGNGYGNNRRTP